MINSNKMSTMLIIIIIIFNSNIICKLQHSVSFYFSILPKEQQFSSQMLLKFISDTPLCIGTPKICKTVQFLPNNYLTFFIEKNSTIITSPYTSYDNTASSSFKYVLQVWYAFFDEIIYKGRHVQDEVSFGPIELEEFQFYLVNEWSPQQNYSVIGLSVDFRQNIFPSFIKQLVDKFIINMREYSIEFYSEAKGRIVFGRENYSNKNKDKDEKRVIELKISNLSSPVIHYFTATKVYIGKEDNIIAKHVDIIFNEAFGFIQVGIEMKIKIINNYLIDLNCNEKEMNLEQYKTKTTVYAHFICDKRRIRERYDNTDHFKDFVFSFDEGNITLSKDDLFTEYDSKRMQFMIIVTERNVSPQWVIGWPILKRFKITHDYENKTIALFSHQMIQTSPLDKDITNKGGFLSMLSYLFIWMTIVLVIGLIMNVLLYLSINHIKPNIN